jgi:hypothetical protein
LINAKVVLGVYLIRVIIFVKRITMTLLLVSILVACGGGSVNSTSSLIAQPSANSNAPIANAGLNQTVNEQSLVTLSGANTVTEGSTSRYQWLQTFGTPVALSITSKIDPSFTAPSVNVEETLTFELVVSDNNGATSIDSVDVIVIPDAAVALVIPAFNNVIGVDLTNMPDQLPDMLAGQTIELDVSGVLAKGGLKSVRWDLNPRVASRRFKLSLIDKDWRYWYFTAPAYPEDKLLTFDFIGIANEKNENGKRHQAKKKITVFVKAGKGDVIADVEDQADLRVGDSVSIDASGSTSGNGEIVSYIWTQKEGPMLAIDINSPTIRFNMPSFDHADIGTYTNDLKPYLPFSSPQNVVIPNGIKNHFDFKFKGAFSVHGDAGDVGNISFSPSVIGINPENTSIFVAGTRGTVAEMKIPEVLGFAENSAELPIAKVIQDFFKIQDKVTVGELKKYTMNGLLIYKNSLIATVENAYDTKGTPWTIQYASNAYDLANSHYKGFLQLEGKNRAAGFMSEIPDDMKPELGGPFMSGWGSNNSIDNRYSLGPSLYSFNAQDIMNSDVTSSSIIPTKLHLAYSIRNLISEGANGAISRDPIWSKVARAHFGFIVPNTRKYIVFGSQGGLEGGVGYKITQEDGGTENGGPGVHLKWDTYPYFWIFDIDDILSATHEFDPSPISYGKFMVPYALNFKSFIKGGAWNNATNTLYLAVSSALQKKYTNAPIIVTFKVTAKSELSEYPKIPKRISFDLEVIDSMGYSDKKSVSVYLLAD